MQRKGPLLTAVGGGDEDEQSYKCVWSCRRTTSIKITSSEADQMKTIPLPPPLRIHSHFTRALVFSMQGWLGFCFKTSMEDWHRGRQTYISSVSEKETTEERGLNDACQSGGKCSIGRKKKQNPELLYDSATVFLHTYQNTKSIWISKRCAHTHAHSSILYLQKGWTGRSNTNPYQRINGAAKSGISIQGSITQSSTGKNFWHVLQWD